MKKCFLGMSLVLFCLSAQAKGVITLNGIDGKIKHAVLAALSIEESAEKTLSNRQAGALVLRGEREIAQALKSFGYYTPSIEGSVKDNGKNIWSFSFNINLGKPVKVADIDFKIIGEGQDDLGLFKALQEYVPVTGLSFDHTNYELNKNQLLTAALERGYLEAAFIEHQVEILPASHHASIILHLDTGPLYTFGPIHFSDLSFNQGYLERFAGFTLGEPFSSERMLDFQSALRATNQFSTVQVLPQRSSDSTVIPVQVVLVSKEPHNLLLGLGYTTDTGLRGRLGWNTRYLNANGHSFFATTNVAEKRQQWQLRYQIPGLHPKNDRYQIAVRQFREEIDHRLSDSKTISASSLTEMGSWQRLLKIEYLASSYREVQGLSTVQDHFILPTLNLTQRVADNPIYPERGYRLDLNFRGAMDILLSSETFAQFHAIFKSVYPILGQTHLISRIELGTTLPNSNNLPLILRFFAGGDRSVRGYRFKSLGPTETDGKGRTIVVGGKHLAIASLEVDHPITTHLKGALFIDTGNAMNRFNTSLKTGIGTGLRWQSPVGPIRIDIAYPFEQKFRHEDWRIHLSIGPDL